MLTYSPKVVNIANATARSSGCIGQNALVPRVVKTMAEQHKQDWKILDFGAGPKAIHTHALRQDSFDVTAWEFGRNFNPDVHDAEALQRKYDVVFASNVVNVLADEVSLLVTLRQIRSVLKDDGFFVFNYPKSPRKLPLMDNSRLRFLVENCRFLMHSKYGGVAEKNGVFLAIPVPGGMK